MYFLKSALLSTPTDFERAAWHAGEHLSWCVLGFPPLSSSSAAHMKQNWRGKLKSKTHVFQSARCQISPPPPTPLKGGTGHVDSAASSWMVKINKCKAKKKKDAQNRLLTPAWQRDTGPTAASCCIFRHWSQEKVTWENGAMYHTSFFFFFLFKRFKNRSTRWIIPTFIAKSPGCF